ncbi:hypothetical protein [Bacillus weihaiensis]|uniref:Uncharacterized protein n=1 Tax=Bacillus weihaiensis TaxID=1547283 RepID=A0A1L3MR97_9BACI|nr:hypothetical protein [Bacillus weihaiensis]APH04858.1 hypothetical protein A9C19_08920 [Bacillus weihaiensis]
MCKRENRLTNYWLAPIIIPSYTIYGHQAPYVALFAGLSCLLQLCGNFIPLFGLFIGPFAALPILVASLISLSSVFYTYFLSFLLLVIIQPTELFTFPFTTGLLGICYALGVKWLKRRLFIVLCSSGCLLSGVMFLLSLFQVPILGAMSFSAISLMGWLTIVLFFTTYSWVFFDICLVLFLKIRTKLR